ncbi:MAG: bile acid:sodium symporter [Actinobacteria bacterium]|nr:bile acid:sodium symporter [Actinomycetota bacterium]
MGFSGTPFDTLVLVFVASTLFAVGLGTTGQMLQRTVSRGLLFLGALVVNLVLIPALGWGLAEVLAPDGPTFIALVLAAASPGGPFGAKLAQIQRGDAVAGAALMAILAVIGSLSVPIVVAFILSTAAVGSVGNISIAVGPLIVRIVVSQIVPFSLGMVARAASARRAERVQPAALMVSTVSFVILLAWILIEGFGDVVSLSGSFLLAAVVLIVLAVLFGTLLAPGPAQIRTTAGAIAGVRNAAPMLAVISAEFANKPGILPAVAAIVLVELFLQLPWNLWLARRRVRV